MDKNKLDKLKSINYSIHECCGICKHSNHFSDDWSTCKIHTYEHQKHSTSLRDMSIFKYGYCRDFELNVDLGSWQEFIGEKHE
jgi:hypothetical protein